MLLRVHHAVSKFIDLRLIQTSQNFALGLRDTNKLCDTVHNIYDMHGRCVLVSCSARSLQVCLFNKGFLLR